MTIMTDAPTVLTRIAIAPPICELAEYLIRLADGHTGQKPNMSGDITLTVGDTAYWCALRVRSPLNGTGLLVYVDVYNNTKGLPPISMELTEQVNAALRGMFAYNN